MTVSIVPECTYDEDCANHEHCRDGTCQDVCRLGPCGVNTICTGEDHKHVCRCAPGFYGDPRIACARGRNFSFHLILNKRVLLIIQTVLLARCSVLFMAKHDTPENVL